MPRLLYRRAARADLDAIYDYIAEDNPRAALAHIVGLRQRLRVLTEHPRLGRERPDLSPGLRILPIGGTALVAYRILADTVVILRVFHGGQDYEGIMTDDTEERRTP